ncbi:hypothetical protein ANCCEY_03220 [Ancylostoma ceylanicum]|uniref:Thioredoxin domain-containing protein n=1 Tax=Ancylostoma ceylanicum TaxID=53326 RepID=A0A0D6M5M1_9BILA|nr:hypothetical protein ANCCEY_03220 [Ancylostoma ceylanicum]
MRLVTFLVALVLGVSAGGDVLEYTDSNFDELIKSHEVALVKFYAPWRRQVSFFEAVGINTKLPGLC